MSKIHNISDGDLHELSGEFARPYLIGMISAFANDQVPASDAERLEAIRACLAAYRSCQHPPRDGIDYRERPAPREPWIKEHAGSGGGE
jgi:hypothetical protein